MLQFTEWSKVCIWTKDLEMVNEEMMICDYGKTEECTSEYNNAEWVWNDTTRIEKPIERCKREIK